MSKLLEAAFPTEHIKDLQAIETYVEFSTFDEYRTATINHLLIHIPYRIYNPPLSTTKVKTLTLQQQLILFCIFTRHHNGFIRHEMVKNIMQIHPTLEEDDFIIPYIFLLLGEYVAEICEDLYPYIKANRSVINNFMQKNTEFSYLTYQRSVSYWNEYYRQSIYKDYRNYPTSKVFDLFTDLHIKNFKLRKL